MNTFTPKLSLIFLAALFSGCGDPVSEPVTIPLSSGIQSANFDRSVRPQDDLYRYVNGAYLDRLQIPADQSIYGAYFMVVDSVGKQLRIIAEQAASANAAVGSDQQEIGDLFASFMDEKGIEHLGVSPLMAEFARIDALDSPGALARYFGTSQRIGLGGTNLFSRSVSVPLIYEAAIDERNATAYTSYLAQSGLGLPDRDYYLADEPRFKDIREQYRSYIRRLLEAAGDTNAAAAGRIYALEEKLARAQWTRLQNRDVEKTYNRYELAAAAKLVRGFDWVGFLEGAGVDRTTESIVIRQPSYFEALGNLLHDVPMRDWKEYLRFRLLDDFAPYLSSTLAGAHFDFKIRTLTGASEQRPRAERAVFTLQDSMGELLGKAYVARHFGGDAKHRIDLLVANMRKAFSAGIDELEWMTPETKVQAHKKLSSLRQKIGHPDRWGNWSRLEIRRDDLVGNLMRAYAFEHDRRVARLHEPVDRDEWPVSAATVDAFYNPTTNEIVFPAAFLQPPFFDPAADDAVNYGAVGGIIGHEISHAFDDQGRKYNGDGNLQDWWKAMDDREFRNRAQRLVQQYGTMEPLPGVKVNGEFTLGENIADTSGLAVAHRAYMVSLAGKEGPTIDGFTAEQRFYIGWAQMWPWKFRDDALRGFLMTNQHSPTEYRCNISVSNHSPFYRAFDVKPGDRLHRPPAERAEIW